VENRPAVVIYKCVLRSFCGVLQCPVVFRHNGAVQAGSTSSTNI